MPANPVTTKVTASLRWWVPLYLNTLCAAAILMGAEPDWKKATAFVAQRGIRIRVA